MTNPTQADRKLATDISFFCVEREVVNGELDVRFNLKKAMDMVSQHVQEAVKAETQRMCDVAYAVYNDHHNFRGDYADGAYAVVEALGKEVK